MKTFIPKLDIHRLVKKKKKNYNIYKSLIFFFEQMTAGSKTQS